MAGQDSSTTMNQLRFDPTSAISYSSLSNTDDNIAEGTEWTPVTTIIVETTQNTRQEEVLVIPGSMTPSQVNGLSLIKNVRHF